jgi:hypothetical protein
MWNRNILSNFTMETATVPAIDKGKGFRIGTASDKPRMILGVSCYAGTNTTNVVPVLAMVPGIQLDSNTFDANTDLCVYIARSSQPITSTLATTYSPGVIIPYIETRAGGGTFPILPPGWLLIAITGDVDADGTVLWQVASCDLG